MSGLIDDLPPIRLGIFGDPIAHSLSPLFQNAALQAAKINCRYEAFKVTTQELPEALAALRKSNFLGINLTMPHKQKALDLLDEVTPHARLLDSINTIVVSNQKLIGHNTDGPGFIRALQRGQFRYSDIFGSVRLFLDQPEKYLEWHHNIRITELTPLRILILGANGGTGRALAAQCALEGCKALYLASRTPCSPHAFFPPELLQTLSPSLKIESLSLQQKKLAEVMPHIDLIINATPLGMKEEDPLLIPSSFFRKEQFLYDVIYTSTNTPLMKAALQGGARACNGLSMLLHQGALAFELWLNQVPSLEVMR